MSYITKVVLRSPLTDIEFPVAAAKPDDQYVVRSINGLGPPVLDISIADGLYQGGIYHGSLPQDREIVIQARLNPRYKTGFYSAAGLRTRLYSMLAGQYATKVYIYTDSENEVDESRFIPSVMFTNGYVKNLVIGPFDKDNEVQITLLCPLAWFQDLEDTTEPVPIENPFVYNATAPTGFFFESILKSATSSFTLTIEGNDVTAETIYISYPLQVDDVIRIDTRPGTRSVKYIRPLVSPYSVDITGYVTVVNNLWPSLRPGSNKFVVYSYADTTQVLVEPQVFQYRKQYWGV